MIACVIVPTYNERENVAFLLQRIKAMRSRALHVLFVDDSSPDGTAEVVRREAEREAWVHLLVREGKKGIGSAHIEGFAEAIKSLSADMVVEMDADLQQPPEKIPELLAAVEAGADVAVASRKVPGGGAEGWSLWRRTVSWAASAYARNILGIGVRDCTSGFRALNRRAASLLVESGLRTPDYTFQVASLFFLKRRGMKFVEVPFVFGVRAAGKSKLGWGEILRFFFGVLRLRLSSGF